MILHGDKSYQNVGINTFRAYVALSLKCFGHSGNIHRAL